ncbi:MAG: NifU family protein [Betaproteobacteria bacterium]|nr:NifU family protein [Betaproteobacteria bacterium]
MSVTGVNPSTQRQAIQRFIDEKIAPGVQSHGGDVLIEGLENGILTISLSGACGSCNVQAYTSESIANYILEEFPDLDDVVVSGPS